MNANVLLLCTLIIEMLAARQFPHCQRNCFFFCIHVIELYRPRVQIHTHRCYFPEEVLFSMKYVIFQFKEETYWFAYVKKFGQFFKFAIRNLYHTFPLFFLLSLSLPLVCFVYFTELRECFVFFSLLMKMWFSAAQKWLKRSPGEKEEKLLIDA